MRIENFAGQQRVRIAALPVVALAGACLALAACDRAAKAPSEPSDTGSADAASSRADGIAPDVQRVAASDTIGAGLSEIAGIAFWTHPTLSFEGLVIAATGDGLVGLVIENGAEAARVAGFAATGVAVSYVGEGQSAQGYAVAAVDGDPAFKFYAIDNVTREFLLKPTMFIAEKTDGGFCFGRTADGDELALHQTTSAGLTSHALSFSSGGIAASDVVRRPFERGLVDCVVDDASGDVYALDAEGGIVRFGDGKQGERPSSDRGSARRAYKRGSIGLVLSDVTADAGDVDEVSAVPAGPIDRRIAIARLNSGNGVVDVLDGETGSSLGAVRLGETFDDKGVAKSATLGVGYGNFGGVYRDGVLALVVVEEDGASAIRLAPWGGVSAALGQAPGTPVDPRTPRPAAAVPELRFDLPQP